ncbi:MAG: MBL fold metallo-hydrolase [Candidatus Woesearchaeota archaeon]
MRLTFHGSAMEVGRNCIEVDDKFFLDCGIKFSEEGVEYPNVKDFSKIRAVFLSHAHLDHSGALPMFNHLGLNCPVYCNSMIKEISKILLKDSYNIEILERQNPVYSKSNISNVLGLMENIKYSRDYYKNDCVFRFLYSGHIPGSASVLLDHSGKRLLYTSDINCSGTRLMNASSYKVKDVDVMICEATYGDRNHAPRNEVEAAFLSKIGEVVENGGSVLIPVFAVGRAQEIMLVLKERKFDCPIYVDGMSKKITNLLLRKPEFVKEPQELSRAMQKVKFVNGIKDRQEIVKEQAIVLTTSGMLDGGPALDYLKYYYYDPKNAILLTGFQTEDSNGRLLLEQRRVYVDGIRFKVKAFVEKYDFSAHAGRDELIHLIEQTSPKTLILHHGDPSALHSLYSYFKDKLHVYVPHIGDKVDV